MTTMHSDKKVSGDELGAVMPRIAALLAESVDADRCAIFAYDEDQTRTIAIYRYGYSEDMLAVHGRTDPIPPPEIPAEAEVIRTGQPIQRRFPEDDDKWPLINPGQEQQEGRWCDLVLPLTWNDRVHGVSYIWRAGDPTPFSEGDIVAASAVGALAALAIVFARQYQQERLSRQRLDSLLDVATVATSDAGIDEILQYLAHAIRSATEADVCSLYVLDSDLNSALVSYQDGVDDSERVMFLYSHDTLVSDVPAEMRVRETLQAQIVRDFERELTQGSALTEFVSSRPTSEILLVPMVFQGKMTGVIYAWYRDPSRTFPSASIEMAEGIASQAGGVVERARLHEETRRQAAESDALLRIGQSVLTSDTLEPVLDEIAESLQPLIPYDYAYVGLLNDDRTAIQVIQEWGYNTVPIVDMSIPVDRSLSGLSVRTGQVVRSGDVEADPRSWSDDPKSPTLYSLIVAPLISDRGTLGTLFIGRRMRHAFTPHDERLMSLLSQHAALAIDRVHARETQVNRAQRDAFLTSAVDLLVSSEDTRSVLPRIADMAAGVVADGVLIGLSDWRYGNMEWTASSYVDQRFGEQFAQLVEHVHGSHLRDRIERALRTDQEALVDSRALSPEQEYLRPFIERLDLNQILVVPLVQPERAKGLMIFCSMRTSPRFTQEDIELSRIVAHRIGDALEREQVRHNQEAMLRVSETLHGQSDLEDVENVLMLELAHILPCDQLYIGELNREAGCIQPHVYRVDGADVIEEGTMAFDSGMCGEVIHSRQPIMDNEADLRKSRVYRDASERAHYQQNGESALAAPLIVEDDVIGVLYVSRTGRDRFTTADFETFLLFAGMAGAALDQASLVQRNRELYRASVEVLAAVVDAKDPMTLEHSRRVAYYSQLIATLLDLPEDQVGQIELAGLLHDIGKLGIPDRILRKPGGLSAEEFEIIKRHPDWGADILQRHPALTDLSVLVRHHHEWFDGSGYPGGYSGEATPLGSSIIAVADAFDTMTTVRTYQGRRGLFDALDELESCAGSQFHPEVVQRFTRSLRQDPGLLYEDRSLS